MVARGGFEKLGTTQVRGAQYIGVGSSPKIVDAPLADAPPDKIWAELAELIRHWQDPSTGFTARMAPERIKYDSDYDHLARRGEWDDTDDPHPEVLE